ncbi:MAG: DNA polymerase III subunit delta' [Sphingomonadaceae bacterium]
MPRAKPAELKRNLTVDQIRVMQRRSTTRLTLGDKRAIIIDPADDMETSAVNALLKSLEEPPVGTYFLLIAHQPGKLLPTIRSRCRILRFAQMTPQQIDALLMRDMPEADADLRHAAIAASQGSPGVALSFVEHRLAVLHDLMVRILREGDRNFELRGELAKEMGTRPRATNRRLRWSLRGPRSPPNCRSGRNGQLRIIEAHGALTKLSAQMPIYNFDPGLLVMEIGGLLASVMSPREAAQIHS